MIAAIGLTFIFFLVYSLILWKTGTKSQPKPGRDYDERGQF